MPGSPLTDTICGIFSPLSLPNCHKVDSADSFALSPTRMRHSTDYMGTWLWVHERFNEKGNPKEVSTLESK